MLIYLNKLAAKDKILKEHEEVSKMKVSSYTAVKFGNL